MLQLELERMRQRECYREFKVRENAQTVYRQVEIERQP